MFQQVILKLPAKNSKLNSVSADNYCGKIEFHLFQGIK